MIVTRCIPYYRREPAPLLASGKVNYAHIGRLKPGRGHLNPEPRPSRRGSLADLFD